MVRVYRQQGVSVLELGSRYDSLDAKVLGEFDAMLRAATEDQTAPPCLLLDLSQTEYVGSGFIELLLRTWRDIGPREGKIAVCGPSPFCEEVLQTARLDALWPLYPTRDAALKELAKP